MCGNYSREETIQGQKLYDISGQLVYVPILEETEDTKKTFRN